MMNMDEENSGGGDFNMRSAIEDHMSKEDLGPEASKQDWSDLQTLREDLRYWEESMSHLLYPIQEVNRWSQVPPRSKEISCFHADTKVRMYTTIPGAPIQEDGQIGQRRQALDKTIQAKSNGTKPRPD